MIKRKVRIFTRDDLFQDFLDRMDEDTTIAHYAVNDRGTHYIITERSMKEDESKQFKIDQIEKDIAKSREYWLRRIKNIEKSIQMYNDVSNYRMSNLFVQDREEAIDEFNEEQNKLNKELDKLKNQ